MRLFHVALEAEISARPPPAVKMESFLPMAPGYKRQIHQRMPSSRDIPTAIRAEIVVRKAPASRHSLIGHADDIKGEIVQRITETPFRQAVFVIGSVRFGWDWVIGVLKPPDGIEFVPRADDGVPRPGLNTRTAPLGMGFHLGGSSRRKEALLFRTVMTLTISAATIFICRAPNRKRSAEESECNELAKSATPNNPSLTARRNQFWNLEFEVSLELGVWCLEFS